MSTNANDASTMFKALKTVYRRNTTLEERKEEVKLKNYYNAGFWRKTKSTPNASNNSRYRFHPMTVVATHQRKSDPTTDPGVVCYYFYPPEYCEFIINSRDFNRSYSKTFQFVESFNWRANVRFWSVASYLKFMFRQSVRYKSSIVSGRLG